jgi:hypothetical protein
MYAIDYTETELLINSIIAIAAVIGMVISLGVVAWQFRHQSRIETKNVEQQYLRELLRLLDKPLDLALSNVMECDYLRATKSPAMQSAELLHQARPELMLQSRDAYQEFTNSAASIITVLPACRRQRGLKKGSDAAYEALAAPLWKLVEAYEQLSIRYGNTAELVKVGLNDFLADQRQIDAKDLLVQVRHAASQLLAQLYS